MRFKLLILLLFSGLWSRYCLGIDTSGLPIIGDKFPFTLLVEGDTSALQAVLQQELRRQRKHNLQLKQFSSAQKIARLESQLLTERLHAEGYYDAEVQFELDGKHITYQVNSAAPYRIKEISLKLPEGLEVPQSVLKLSLEAPLRAEEVLAAETHLQDYIAQNYCLKDIDSDYHVLAESSSQAAYLEFTVADSPAVNFGDIRFSGLESIDEDYLLDRLRIKKGECFKRAKLDAASVRLIRSNLLGNITASIGEVEQGEVPITLHAVERHHRTISAGFSYQTDEGFGLSLGWENRNLKGRAERLKIDSQFGETQQSLKFDLTLPHFQRNNRSITLYSQLTRENTNAFQSNVIDLGAEVSRQLKRKLRAKIGTEMSFSNVEDNGQEENFALFSFPFSFEYDKRNDPLDPTRGWVGATRLRPFWNAHEETRFLKSTLALSAYHSFSKWQWQPTLALRSAFGSIDGANREQVAANLRFYVGGGGSVRGYPFQSLGPLDGKTPLGGLSFSDFSIETRTRWGKNWGGVVFLDGGFAYEERSPRVGEDLHWGAGLGLRYYTSFAPIRFDIAFPLNQREGIDDEFQLYISIGQAF